MELYCGNKKIGIINMVRRAYRRQWLRLKTRYEKRASRIFRKAIRETALQIPFDKLTVSTYPGYISFYVNQEKIKQAYLDTYTQIGLAHGRRVGQGLNQEIRKEKNFAFDSFESVFIQFIQNWLLTQGGQRIVSVRDEVAKYIIEYIAKRIEESADIRAIARELEKHIRSQGFYRWQIERIVRTETTAAANYGAIYAAEDSGLVYEKEWISAHDPRTRRPPKSQYDHWNMDGVRVPKDGMFDVNGDQIEFPGDPKGQPGNVISCRCSVSVVPKRDENGRLVFASGVNPYTPAFV